MISSYLSSLPKIYRIPLIVVGVAAIGSVAVSVFGYVVMWLWNHALTGVVEVPAITFWQALGLFLLAKLFFGFGGGSQGGGPRRGRHMKHREQRLRETDEPLPDTDELFKQYWRDEGKQAYEAYLAAKESGASNDGT
jgi:hypothetical protein